RNPCRVFSGDGNGDSGGPDDYDMNDEEMEEFNNNKDFDIEYDPLVATIAAAAGSDDVGDENISIV
ncbi:hypothetical protein Csa_023575, partial [Cucumis sativus]